MAENYFLLFKHIPIGHHTITAEVIRVPLQANQPVEHDLAKWDINIVRRIKCCYKLAKNEFV